MVTSRVYVHGIQWRHWRIQAWIWRDFWRTGVKQADHKIKIIPISPKTEKKLYMSHLGSTINVTYKRSHSWLKVTNPGWSSFWWHRDLRKTWWFAGPCTTKIPEGPKGSNFSDYKVKLKTYVILVLLYTDSRIKCTLGMCTQVEKLQTMKVILCKIYASQSINHQVWKLMSWLAD